MAVQGQLRLSPEGGVRDGQLVAVQPLVALLVILLDPVTDDGAASVLVRLDPSQSHRVPGHV